LRQLDGSFQVLAECAAVQNKIQHGDL